MEKHHFNKNFIHHQKSSMASVLSEVIFGMEDGLVSTLGSITGIAVGSGSQSTVLLAGSVIIAVESISMGIGSYLSNKSEEEMNKRKIAEEREEIIKFPKEEREELFKIYIKEGWPENLARPMADTASKNENIFLNEMITRELNISPDEESVSIKGGFYMFFAYVIGGAVPLFAYLFLPIKSAMPISIGITLIGLFLLGISTTKFTKQPLIKSGLRMFIMGGIALAVGLAAGLLIGQ